MSIPSYERQAKIIAIIEIATSIFSLLTISITTLVLSLSPSIREDVYHSDPNNIFNILIHFPITEKVPLVVVPTLYFIGELVLAILLFRSVDKRNYKRCRIWYIITVTVCMTGLYFFIPGIFFTDDSYYFIVIFIGSYAFTIYSVWVVHSLMQELKAEGLHHPVTQWDDDIDKF